MSSPITGDNLQRHWCSGVVETFYRRLGCHRRWRIARALLALCFRLEGGQQFSATARRMMDRFHQVKIGAYSYGPCFDPAIAQNSISVGRYTSIASGVRFFTRNHPIEHKSTHPAFYDSRPPNSAISDNMPGLHIGDDVWIGCNAIITPGCRQIGIGAVVGAGAVVTRDVAPYAVVAGNPAREIKRRFDQRTISTLMRERWWERPLEENLRRFSEFNAPATASQIANNPVRMIGGIA